MRACTKAAGGGQGHLADSLHALVLGLRVHPRVQVRVLYVGADVHLRTCRLELWHMAQAGHMGQGRRHLVLCVHERDAGVHPTEQAVPAL